MSEELDGYLGRREDYGQRPLEEAGVLADPIAQFRRWLEEATDAGLYEPNAMVLSTIESDGTPSSRTVLLRGVESGAFEFFTNYSSAKGLALAANPVASLLFPWYVLHRQVIVRGTVERSPTASSEAYFASRPHDSQVASAASEQSRPVSGREELEQRVRELGERYAGMPVPRPEHWGGYLVHPRSIEFWQGRRSRLHDRLLFTRDAAGWTLQRLQP